MNGLLSIIIVSFHCREAWRKSLDSAYASLSSAKVIVLGLWHGLIGRSGKLERPSA